MSIFNIKTACFQSLKCRLYLPSFFVKCLSHVWFIKRYYYLQLRNILLVDYFGSREIAKFSINPNNLAIESTFIDSEVIKQSGSLCPLPVGGFLKPEVFTYANMILYA